MNKAAGCHRCSCLILQGLTLLGDFSNLTLLGLTTAVTTPLGLTLPDLTILGLTPAGLTLLGLARTGGVGGDMVGSLRLGGHARDGRREEWLRG